LITINSIAEIELTTQFLAASPDREAELTIMTANLLNPFARLSRVDERNLLDRLEAFAQLVEREGAAVLLCQEVGRGRNFRVDNWIVQRLEMACVYTRANGDAERLDREEGLAIFSRYPLSRPVSCLLAGGLWRRPALGAVVHSPLGEVALYTAHLSLRPWRNRRQPAKLRAWVEATAGSLPAVIGGDFNAHETAPQIVALRTEWVDTFRALHPTADGTTHEMRLLSRVIRRRRLDYIFLCQLASIIRIVSSETLQPPAPFSDHQPVLTAFSKGDFHG
jgi:endonuclease/exonuclease/phosphatase family metal-dependent hydrolase